MKLNLIGISESEPLSTALADVADLLDIQLDQAGIPVHLVKSKHAGDAISLSLEYDGVQAKITYGADHQVFRALGLLRENLDIGKSLHINEQPVYERLGVMVDCSRNAVMHFEAFKRLVRHLALMGYSTIQLYMEDTYEIPEHPYFGYMRGRYTGQELQAMDHYAAQFGIEVVPCIQTLAHLNQPLQWPAFSHVHDVDDILLAEEEATYQLIDAMFRTLSANLTSRTIHIGMDEAHMLGLGKYLDKHGYQDRMQILLRHFERVMELARKYGYQPMMWSDMFFRLANNGEYYATDAPIREDVIEQIPDDITLVYWDYYSTKPEIYETMMRKHKQMSNRVVFAGGAWKWMGFSPNNEFSKFASELAHQSCVSTGIQEVLVTAWGDNGAEASMFSVLPTLQLWAELCYGNRSDDEHLERRFRTCTQGSYLDFMQLDLPMLVPDNPSPGKHSINPPKYLLYQDILCGLLDRHVIPTEYAAHYRHAAEQLSGCVERNSKWASLFATQAALCRILEIKCEAGIQIRAAYRTEDRRMLEQYAQEILPELRSRTDRFMQLYREQWLEENKIFGLDVFDIRMGGLLQRIDSAIARLEGYLDGRYSQLEELEQDVLYYDGRTEEGGRKAVSANLWHRIATASVLAGKV